MKESAGTYALPTLCLIRVPLVSFSVCFSRRCNIRCRHGHLPPLAGFTGHGKDVCVLGVVVTSEHRADVIPPSGMRDSLWSRVVVTPAAMVRPVSRVLGHRGARRLTDASHVPLMFSL